MIAQRKTRMAALEAAQKARYPAMYSRKFTMDPEQAKKEWRIQQDKIIETIRAVR